MSDAPGPAPRHIFTHVLATTRVGPDAYTLTLRRNGLAFEAGQVLTLHGCETTEDRDYSFAGGERDDHLLVLYRHIPTGRLTSRLVDLAAGDAVRLTGPYGRFTLRDLNRPIVFIATGTGIAPCRSYARSHPDLDLTVIHGVTTRESLYFEEELNAFRYYPCVSREETDDASRGRVTELVPRLTFAPGSHFYLCGAFEMIAEVSDGLEQRGVPPEDIFTETYYYRAAV